MVKVVGKPLYRRQICDLADLGYFVLLEDSGVVRAIASEIAFSFQSQHVIVC